MSRSFVGQSMLAQAVTGQCKVCELTVTGRIRLLMRGTYGQVQEYLTYHHLKVVSQFDGCFYGEG
jgi:hypothetical protein